MWRLLALVLTNNRIPRERLPVPNTLAYFVDQLLSKFYNVGTWPNPTANVENVVCPLFNSFCIWKFCSIILSGIYIFFIFFFFYVQNCSKNILETFQMNSTKRSFFNTKKYFFSSQNFLISSMFY